MKQLDGKAFERTLQGNKESIKTFVPRVTRSMKLKERGRGVRSQPWFGGKKKENRRCKIPVLLDKGMLGKNAQRKSRFKKGKGVSPQRL